MEFLKKIKKVVMAIVVLILFWLILYEGLWQWGVCRIYVDPGNMLLLTAKFGDENPRPDELRVVPAGMKGVQDDVLGEGRHFYNPITYETNTRNRVIEIPPKQIGLVESKSGKSLPPGEFLAEKGYKGIQRTPLTPGKWRLNPVACKVTPLPATIIPPGYVGCVTSLSGKIPPKGRLAKEGERGILSIVLQPGIYYLNPREYRVDLVEIGYRLIGQEDIRFPSKDGFPITLHMSVIWGIEPQNVPYIVDHFGNVQDVVKKVIHPQVESICRIEGSKYGAKEFIKGATREKFQTTFTEQLKKICGEKRINVLLGLVRTIIVPKEVKDPLQKAKIAEEERLTKEQQRMTQTIINELEELKSDVQKGVREVAAETDRSVAKVLEEGQRKVANIKASKEVEVAAIMRKVAEIDAEKERVLGKAKANVTEAIEKAKANRLEQMVQAMGDPVAYANYIFAQGLPKNFRVFLRYAGEGTFWTDLPAEAKSLEKLAGMKILEGSQKRARGYTAPEEKRRYPKSGAARSYRSTR
jgi:regulator of protease activity HflC (stomatin/prohibitin superfamily)